MSMPALLLAVAVAIAACVGGGAATEAEAMAPECRGGRVRLPCRLPCAVTCANFAEVERAEHCKVRDCRKGGFCVCPGDKPVWDKEEEKCVGLDTCDDHMATDVDHGDASNCAPLSCNSRQAPWRCPEGSERGHPTDDSGCKGCNTCVNASGHAVEVPPCWRTHAVCESGECPSGTRRKLVERADKLGGLPCCHTFDCV